MADVLNFLLPFVTDHLLPGLDREQAADVTQTMQVVRGQVRGIEAYIKKRMNELRSELKDAQDRMVVCPECAQRAFVLGGGLPGCRFCLKTWDDPAETAAEYAWQLYGLDPHLPGVADAETQVCPDCEADVLVTAVTAAAPDTPSILCVSQRFDGVGWASAGWGCWVPGHGHGRGLIPLSWGDQAAAVF
ncbi:hypothetical protein QCN29_17895 [Streptomyces sp. HNM0663]|uniref:Uncharacterized protein n=1 Tax=Streptomyces chengmaiensis TaxID=3040919 RepID=A0ABT6HPH9_9ACTN|nr:hypothetical protein [Streptomyces chengmaiensis]MDH2390630.1 hypothetical protein [Streptomyces chengmaiensis]